MGVAGRSRCGLETAESTKKVVNKKNQRVAVEISVVANCSFCGGGLKTRDVVIVLKISGWKTSSRVQ